jgi:hypothetical protein
MTALLRSLIALLFFHSAKYKDSLTTPVSSPEPNIEATSSLTSYSKKEGSVLTLCILRPGTTAVGDSFLLNVKQAFIEQPAPHAPARQRAEPDTAGTSGPWLVLAYQPSSRLGKLGSDWDLKLDLATRNPTYWVREQDHVLTFRLPPSYAHRPFALRLRTKNAQGQWKERLLKVYPAKSAS